MRMVKLPQYFGFVGVVTGIVMTAIWMIILVVNPFHVPTVNQMPYGYTVPTTVRLLDQLLPILIPGLLIQSLTIDLGTIAGVITWIVAVGLNYPIYYGIGFLVVTMLNWIRPSDRSPST